MLHFSGCQQCSTEFLLPRPEKKKTAGRHRIVRDRRLTRFRYCLYCRHKLQVGPVHREKNSFQDHRVAVRLVQDMLDPEDHRAKLRTGVLRITRRRCTYVTRIVTITTAIRAGTCWILRITGRNSAWGLEDHKAAVHLCHQDCYHYHRHQAGTCWILRSQGETPQPGS